MAGWPESSRSAKNGGGTGPGHRDAGAVSPWPPPPGAGGGGAPAPPTPPPPFVERAYMTRPVSGGGSVPAAAPSVLCTHAIVTRPRGPTATAGHHSSPPAPPRTGSLGRDQVRP